MPPYKQPSFQERAALAAKAKQDALEKMRAKPPVDEAVVAKRLEAERAREAALVQARADRLAARELEKVAKLEKAAAKAVETAKAATPKLTAEEQKAARDARYAARKNRVGK
jgi:hypothetical protein